MNLFTYFNLSYNSLSLTLDRMIGSGSQGEVYCLKKEPNKVIKLSLLDSWHYQRKANREYIKSSFLSVMGYLKENHHSCCAKVYDFGVKDIPKQLKVRKYENFSHFSFSILEKLKEISRDEQLVFDCIAHHFDIKERDLEKVTQTIKKNCYHYGIEIDFKKIIDFYSQVISIPINHNDFLGCNFMLDDNDNYKLIDFDRATLVKGK